MRYKFIIEETGNPLKKGTAIDYLIKAMEFNFENNKIIFSFTDSADRSVRINFLNSLQNSFHTLSFDGGPQLNIKLSEIDDVVELEFENLKIVPLIGRILKDNYYISTNSFNELSAKFRVLENTNITSPMKNLTI